MAQHQSRLASLTSFRLGLQAVFSCPLPQHLSHGYKSVTLPRTSDGGQPFAPYSALGWGRPPAETPGDCATTLPLSTLEGEAVAGIEGLASPGPPRGSRRQGESFVLPTGVVHPVKLWHRPSWASSTSRNSRGRWNDNGFCRCHPRWKRRQASPGGTKRSLGQRSNRGGYRCRMYARPHPSRQDRALGPAIRRGPIPSCHPVLSPPSLSATRPKWRGKRDSGWAKGRPRERPAPLFPNLTPLPVRHRVQ